ncbi:MAG: hypothetical protein KIT18_14990, partial [Burkholderiales bacterium]|nr:hypothetical protein [Burkholderiales bacterium]
MNGVEHGRRWLAPTDLASVPATGGDATDYDTLPVNPSGKVARLDQKHPHLPGNSTLLTSRAIRHNGATA